MRTSFRKTLSPRVTRSMIAHLTDNPYVEHEPEIQSQSGEEFDDEEVHKPKWVRRWKIK